MVSTNQSGASESWDSKQDRFIQSSMDILPLLRGATSKEERQAWASAMNRAEREFPDSYYEILLGE